MPTLKYFKFNFIGFAIKSLKKFFGAALTYALLTPLPSLAQTNLTTGFQLGYLAPAAVELSQLANDQTRDLQCQATYARIFNQRRMVINVGLGYFDQSRGYPYVYDGKSYGLNAALDSFAYSAFVKILTAPCRGQGQACGFTIHPRSSSHPLELYKSLGPPFPISVALILQHGSASWNHEENLSSSSGQQQTSAQSESLFFDQICNADVSLYMGHSRNGGGPDFRPPVLLANGHPNYKGYYEKSRPGLNRLLQNLRRSDCRRPMLLAISSCLSERHFGIALENAAPGMGLALSGNSELMPYSDILKSGLAVIDSALRFQCAGSFQHALRTVSSSSEYLQLRNFAGSPSVDRRAASAPLPHLNED